ncbi:MAG TPA: diguanylate cyclase, partial [Vicinamibacteria bacterium]
YLAPAEIGPSLQPWAAFLEEDSRARSFQGVYAGLVLGLVLYNLFLFLAVRDRTYLLYVLYAATFGLIWTVRSGLAFEMLWPSQPHWNQLSSFCLIVAAVVFGNWFVAVFLDIRRHAPWIYRTLHALSSVAGLAALLAALGRWFVAEQILAVASLVTSLTYLAAGLLALRRGYRPARIYLLACGALIAGIVAYVLTFLGALPRNFATLYGVQIGSAAEVLLLAFALGDRIRILRREKDEAQTLYQGRLERAVLERTAELADEHKHLEEARLRADEANRRLQEANERLKQMSLTDDLTGVANRRHFEAMLDEEWRRCVRTGMPLSVIFMDVDHFKPFNDHYGHPEGDRCLRSVAGVLAAGCRRAGDLLARYGGEEFVVLLSGTGDGGAAQKAERLRKAIEDLAIPQSPGVPLPVVTISVGVATDRPTPHGSPIDLMARADRALYAAKRQGRNRLVSAPEATRV